jgi:hypothetical protein
MNALTIKILMNNPKFKCLGSGAFAKKVKTTLKG